MKKQLYEKMESMFHLIEHDYHDTHPLEMMLYQLARGNTYDMRVVGLEGLKKFRKDHPDSSITFKPNHLSEADFILINLLFREHKMRVVTEGGANLFIEDIDIFKHVIPNIINHDFKPAAANQKMSIAQYLSSRGAFKVFREPVEIKQVDGSEIKLGKKEILSLTRAYRYHLVKNKEMYVTFPGYSEVKSSLLELLKKNGMKTGRSYTGKIDGFHHLPFQMDIEASLYTDVDVYIVDVNIAYEQVMEDENFSELTRMHDAGVSKKDIYVQDLGYIIKEFCSDKKKGHLSIKFGQPRKIDTATLKEGLVSRKIKNTAYTYAQETFDRVLSMQPVFPANIYFTAFDENFNRIPVRVMKEKIDDMRDHLRTLEWGKEKRRVDLHYITGYNHHIISADEIINRTYCNFKTPGRHITDIDGDMFVVYNKDVAQQYKNHTAHFFESMENVSKGP
jgi:hypothetical protein